jgi:anti-sigma-K factor RskA
MTEHEYVEERIALHSLGGTEPEEIERIEAHLAGCRACREEAEAERALVSLIAQSVRRQSPRDDVRARVMQRIGTRAAPRERPARRLRPTWALAALNAVVILALIGWNLYLNAQMNSLRREVSKQEHYMSVLLSSARQEIVLTAQDNDPGKRARVYVDPETDWMVIIIDHLPPIGPDQAYQLWLITEAGPQPSILIDVNERGWGMTTLKVPEAQANFDAVGVSVEPAGGSEQPTEVVLAGGS